MKNQSSLNCTRCRKEGTVSTDNTTQAAKQFHEAGWRVVNKKTVCPNCQK